MKIQRLIIFLICATFLIKNAESVDQHEESSKLYKIYDEIFGEGWDEEVPEETKEWHKMETQTREVENKSTDQPNPNEQNFSDHNEIDAMVDQNCDEDDIEFIEENEADLTDQNDCIDGQKCQKMQENGTKLIKRRKNNYSDQQKREILNQYYQIKKSNPKISAIEIAKSLNISRYTLCRWKRELRNIASKMGNDCSAKTELNQKSPNKIYSDQQKREIVEKFIKLKNEYKQKGNHAKKEWYKIYAKISMSIGVGKNTIQKWKKEFGLSIKLHSKKEKSEKLKQYCEIKRNNPKMKEVEISKRLNIGESTLGQWKRELKNPVKDDNDNSLQKELDQITQLKVYSDQQKREIVEKFIKMINEYKQKGKYSLKEWNQNYAQIANCFGVNIGTLWKWKKELDLTRNYHSYSDKEKMEKLKQFFEIKKNNPKMPVSDIANLLNIGTRTLNRWKAKFMGIGVNEKHAEEAADSTDHE